MANKQTCKDCKNVDLCKWCSEMERNIEEVDKIAICKGLTPVSILVECNKFERKLYQQNGFPNFNFR